ncbi:uncharacterized protein LOC131682313 [Topomyia yanbarensis]|uniref:uncharacterized protein LOC131682313 n=1 Tax=Topomyia yanbarensis TaxID=2498891 RepID=UPI00273C4FCB|nr:uncharacterized protein LOC131682313 [Topomyia yanbarensis]
MFILLSALAYCILLTTYVSSTSGITVKYDNSPDTRNSQLRQGTSNDNSQSFHEVDAFGDDYVDFGAHTGLNGAFYWHANYPVEDSESDSTDSVDRYYQTEQERYDYE